MIGAIGKDELEALRERRSFADHPAGVATERQRGELAIIDFLLAIVTGAEEVPDFMRPPAPKYTITMQEPRDRTIYVPVPMPGTGPGGGMRA